MNYASQADVDSKKDEVVEQFGVKVLVDPRAVFYIAGTTMNYEVPDAWTYCCSQLISQESELAAEFTFTNPNAKGECGCGESFNV